MNQYAYAALVMGALIAGTILLSFAFGWQIGVGIGLLVYFHKDEQ